MWVWNLLRRSWFFFCIITWLIVTKRVSFGLFLNRFDLDIFFFTLSLRLRAAFCSNDDQIVRISFLAHRAGWRSKLVLDWRVEVSQAQTLCYAFDSIESEFEAFFSLSAEAHWHWIGPSGPPVMWSWVCGEFGTFFSLRENPISFNIFQKQLISFIAFLIFCCCLWFTRDGRRNLVFRLEFLQHSRERCDLISLIDDSALLLVTGRTLKNRSSL